MQNLDPNKTCGHEKISIHMIKICSESICKPLNLIFNQCIDPNFFSFRVEKGQYRPKS